MAGRLRVLVVLGALCVTAALCDAGSALAGDEPIVGRWQQNGGLVEYYATGPNRFEARDIKKGGGSCTDKPADIKLTGSAGRRRHLWDRRAEVVGPALTQAESFRRRATVRRALGRAELR